MVITQSMVVGETTTLIPFTGKKNQMYACFKKYQYKIILVLFLYSIPELKLLCLIMILIPKKSNRSIRFCS